MQAGSGRLLCEEVITPLRHALHHRVSKTESTTSSMAREIDELK
jgi:hypothetical protein